MRTIVAAVLLLASAISLAPDNGKQISEAKVSCERLKAEWGLKGVSAAPGKVWKDSAEVKVLVRFEKDLPKEVVDDIQYALLPNTIFRQPAQIKDGERVMMLFLDADNVVIATLPVSKVEGKLTGVAGDSFRVQVEVGTRAIAKVTRIELRHAHLRAKK